MPIILYLLSLSGKSLEYEIVSRSELIGEQFSIKNLELKINGESVNKVILYVFRLSNSGSKPILKDDFERPISIHVPDDQKIYLVRLKKKFPENLTFNFELKNNKLLIAPLLLNSEDKFEMELYSSSDEYPQIDARIAGIAKLENKFPDSKRQIKRGIIFVLWFFLVIFYSKSLPLAILKSTYSSNLLIPLGHGMLSLVCGVSSILLLSSVIDIENNKILIFFLTGIPVTLGMIWAFMEHEYNKKMKPIADAPADFKH